MYVGTERRHRELAEFQQPKFALLTPVVPSSQVLYSRPSSYEKKTTMSFAGRRRGNKVKKGVQFTVMVVGQFFFSRSRTRCQR